MNQLSSTFEEIGLPPAVVLKLRRCHLTHVHELEAMSDEEIAAIPRLGAKSYSILAKALSNASGRELGPYVRPGTRTKSSKPSNRSGGETEGAVPDWRDTFWSREGEDFLTWFDASDPTQSTDVEGILSHNETVIGQVNQITEYIEESGRVQRSLGLLVLDAIQHLRNENLQSLDLALDSIIASRFMSADISAMIRKGCDSIDLAMGGYLDYRLMGLQVHSLLNQDPELARQRHEADIGTMPFFFHTVFNNIPAGPTAKLIVDYLQHKFTAAARLSLRAWYVGGATGAGIGKVFGNSQATTARTVGDFRALCPLLFALVDLANKAQATFGDGGPRVVSSAADIDFALSLINPLSPGKHSANYPDAMIQDPGHQSILLKIYSLPFRRSPSPPGDFGAAYPLVQVYPRAEQFLPTPSLFRPEVVGRFGDGAADFLVVSGPEDFPEIAKQLAPSSSVSILDLVPWQYGLRESQQHPGQFALGLYWADGSFSFHPPVAKPVNQAVTIRTVDGSVERARMFSDVWYNFISSFGNPVDNIFDFIKLWRERAS